MRHDDHPDSLAGRKQRLIEQGARLRAEAANARQLAQHLHTATLTRSAAASAVAAVSGLFKGNAGLTFSLIRMALPLAAGAVSALRSGKERAGGRSMIRAGALIALSVLAYRLIARKKKQASGESASS